MSIISKETKCRCCLNYYGASYIIEDTGLCVDCNNFVTGLLSDINLKMQELIQC